MPSSPTTLFKSHKPHNPEWANTHHSLGERITLDCLRSHYTCWRAIGPAKQRFDEDLGPAILAQIHGFMPEQSITGREVFVSIVFVGTSEEKAEPKVVISCRTKKVARELRRLVVKSAILKGEYKGVEVLESRERPGVYVCFDE